MSSKIKLKVSGLLFIFSAILFVLSRYTDNFANFYYKYIYIMLVNTVSRGFSLFSFSIYELILYGFILYVFIKSILYIFYG
ncbi:hypothetical protein DFR98_000098 [Clostridium saccharobutylicum]|nr:hypothetical protein [Clostridium saccharobutylicum]